MNPRLMPSICGRLRRRPKFSPDASSIMLFGPGVTEVTKAKAIKATSSSGLMTGSPARASSLSREVKPVAIQRDGGSAVQSRLVKRVWNWLVFRLRGLSVKGTCMEHNPYSAPRVELLEPLPVVALERWSARHLSLLAWLTLVSLLGTLVLLGFGLVAQRLELGAYQPAIDGLSLALTALGCYLLLRLKAFAEARFAAKHLAWPVGCAVVGYGALGIFEHGVDEVAMASLNWQAFVYLGLMLLAGGLTLWLGIRLLIDRKSTRLNSSHRSIL